MRRAPKLLLPLLWLSLQAAPAQALPRQAPEELVTHGPRSLPRVALTFDADMTPKMERSLENGRVASYDNAAVRMVLREAHVPATFFLTGRWAELYPDAARSIARDPLFEVEDHSYDHPGFEQPCFGLSSVPQDEKAANIRRSQAAILRVTGVTPHYFRFPGGCASEADVALAREQGLTTVHWDVISGDANQPDPGVIVRNVLRRVRDGSVVVMHCHGGPHAPATARALPAIIQELRARGFEFVTVRELLEAAPPVMAGGRLPAGRPAPQPPTARSTAGRAQ